MSITTTFFDFFNMAVVRHLRFLNIRNISCWSSVLFTIRPYASLCQILSKLLELWRRYASFRYFKMAAAAILDF